MNRNKLLKSEVMKIFNTTKETLRHYENLGLIDPEVDSNNYRYYDFDDIRKLRQIFYLRDMDVPLSRIRDLSLKTMSPDEYIKLLQDHHKILEEKQKRQRQLLRDTDQLIGLLKNQAYQRSYNVAHFEDRLYIPIDIPENDSIPTMKDYYDLCIPFIERGIYSERSFILIYPFADLSRSDFINSRQGMEVTVLNSSNYEEAIRFPKGQYLSVFYIFKDGGHEELKELQKDIESYLLKNNYERSGDTVLEMEHPELSILLDEGINIYELQIQVKLRM